MASELLSQFKKKDLRTLSRLISMAENREPEVLGLLSDIYEIPGQAKVVGVTGVPGAGKSTLLNRFTRVLREQGKTVAVVAVDPVSPFTGGSLLGDRVRLTDHFNDPGVFIRSLSTRGKLGGLSVSARQVVLLLEKFGFDYVFVETVGVGQSEVDIRKVADLTLVTLVPEWGDAIQALKAGVLEIADIFVVNKADREGAERIEQELQNLLQISGKTDSAIFKTSVGDLNSVDSLLSHIVGEFAKRAAVIGERRKVGASEAVTEVLESMLSEAARHWVGQKKVSGQNPYRFLGDFLKKNPIDQFFRE